MHTCICSSRSYCARIFVCIEIWNWIVLFRFLLVNGKYGRTWWWFNRNSNNNIIFFSSFKFSIEGTIPKLYPAALYFHEVHECVRAIYCLNFGWIRCQRNKIIINIIIMLNRLMCLNLNIGSSPSFIIWMLFKSLWKK